MKKIFLILSIISFVFCQTDIPSAPDRLKKIHPLSEKYLYDEDGNSVFPFDTYSDEVWLLFTENADFTLSAEKRQEFEKHLSKAVPSQKNDSFVKEREKKWIDTYLSLKKLKEKVDSFDLFYDESFEYVASNGAVYDYSTLKRIYNNIYYETFSTFVRAIGMFSDVVHDYNKNIDLSLSLPVMNEFVHNEYLRLKEDKILKNEISVGFILNKESLEEYFLSLTNNLQYLNASTLGTRSDWYINADRERFYASEHIQYIFSVLNREDAMEIYLLSNQRAIERRLNWLWRDKYLDNKKTGRFTSKFRVFNPKDLTEKDYYNLSRFFTTVEFLEKLEYMNGIAGIYYDGDGNMIEESGLFLSYENYANTVMSLMLFYEDTIKEGPSYSNDINFEKIKKFLPSSMEHRTFHGGEHFEIHDIGISILSSAVSDFVSYSYTFKWNNYMDKYSEVLDLSGGLLRKTNLGKIDFDIKYNKKTINSYIFAYKQFIQEEIVRNMNYNLYNKSDASDLVSLSRNNIQYTKALNQNFYNDSELKDQIFWLEEKFELRIGLIHDIIRNNQLPDLNHLRDFEYYEDYFTRIKALKDDDPLYYYEYFIGLVNREPIELIERIFSKDEIEDLYLWTMDRAFDNPTKLNLLIAAKLDFDFFGATVETLKFLDHGFSVLSQRSMIKDIHEFPEKFGTLGWFWKRHMTMQFFLADRGMYREGEEEELEEVIETGAYSSKKEAASWHSIIADNTLKSLIHSKKDSLSVLEYLQWDYTESYKDTTTFGLNTFHIPTINSQNLTIVHPDSLIVISYNFSVEDDQINSDYLINTIGLYAGTGRAARQVNTILGNVGNIYNFKDAIDISKAMLRNNLIDAFESENNDLIFDILIRPIESQLKNYKNIVIIPDPLLDNFPIESLKDRDGKFLIEKYNFSYANSFDQLFNDFFRKRYPKDEIVSVAFGDINYDAHPSFETLEWSDDEINYIHQNSTFKNTLFERENATETNFRKLLNESDNVTRIHLSLHAFNDNNNYKKSSIIFAKDNDNDGALTYKEAERLDFSNVNLVVLSACETNAGKTVNNFSHLTFQHLFKMNGADNVISTLWKIDDKATFYFMKELYDSINTYFYNTPLAVSNAKRNFILKYPEYNHPYYWAGFSNYGF